MDWEKRAMEQKEEKNKAETGKLVSPCINLHMPHWINTIFLPFLDILSILYAQPFFIGSADRESQMLHLLSCPVM